MPFGLSDELALTVAHVIVEPQVIFKLYLSASLRPIENSFTGGTIAF
jgi:hypothetical protein